MGEFNELSDHIQRVAAQIEAQAPDLLPDPPVGVVPPEVTAGAGPATPITPLSGARSSTAIVQILLGLV